MFNQFEELRDLTREAKAKGLAVVVWSYPRGGDVTKGREKRRWTSRHAAHMTAGCQHHQGQASLGLS